MIPSGMHSFDVSWAAAAPQAEVWDVFVDTVRWPEWGPSVREVVCSDRKIRAGSAGRVRTALGFWIPFEITGFDRPRYWSWSVGGVPATGHRVEAGPGGGSIIVFEVPLAAAPYGLVCMIAAKRIARIAEGEARREKGFPSGPGNGDDSEVAVD